MFYKVKDVKLNKIYNRDAQMIRKKASKKEHQELQEIMEQSNQKIQEAINQSIKTAQSYYSWLNLYFFTDKFSSLEEEDIPQGIKEKIEKNKMKIYKVQLPLPVGKKVVGEKDKDINDSYEIENINKFFEKKSKEIQHLQSQQEKILQKYNNKKRASHMNRQKYLNGNSFQQQYKK